MKILLQPSRKKAWIAFIKQNRRAFYRALWKWYGERGVILSLRDTHSSPIKDALNQFPQNYGFVAELRIIDLVLTNWPWQKNYPGVNIHDLAFIHKKYWERFHRKFVFPRTKKQVPFPHMKKTEAVKEFLARGFVHRDDAINWRGKKYIIECTIAPLVWPQSFDQHGEACKKAAELGIPGYTKCPIPKD